MKIDKLINKAKLLRQKTFDAFIEKGEAHLGGSFSMIEILLFIYENFLGKKDKFILFKLSLLFSKGFAKPFLSPIIFGGSSSITMYKILSLNFG